MYEAYEELIEIWWFKHFAKQKSNNLFQFMCVDRMESEYLKIQLRLENSMLNGNRAQ